MDNMAQSRSMLFLQVMAQVTFLISHSTCIIHQSEFYHLMLQNPTRLCHSYLLCRGPTRRRKGLELFVGKIENNSCCLRGWDYDECSGLHSRTLAALEVSDCYVFIAMSSLSLNKTSSIVNLSLMRLWCFSPKRCSTTLSCHKAWLYT